MQKCPYCEQFITRVVIETPNITDLIWTPLYNWVAYSCPNIMCGKVLSVWIDPIALRTDIINWVLKWLGR